MLSSDFCGCECNYAPLARSQRLYCVATGTGALRRGCSVASRAAFTVGATVLAPVTATAVLVRAKAASVGLLTAPATGGIATALAETKAYIYVCI